MEDSDTDLTTLVASLTIVDGLMDFVVDSGAKRSAEKHFARAVNCAE